MMKTHLTPDHFGRDVKIVQNGPDKMFIFSADISFFRDQLCLLRKRSGYLQNL